MEVLNTERYKHHLNLREPNKGSVLREFLLVILLFGSMGAITWAIRGTSGWGGVDGTVVPGLMWGILCYYIAFRKGIDARGIVLWLGLGIALGGELGYGQYTSWIRGIFYVGEGTIPIKPWLGYFWFIMCGIGWAAPGGILLGWAIGKRVSMQIWIVRSFLLAVLLVLLFAWPIIDWMGGILLNTNSGILFPNISLGIYTTELDKHLSRTVYTNTQNIAVVIWWILTLITAAWQRDKTTIITGLILGGGFGLGFMQSALWTLGYGFAPTYIDWWKLWELNAGFNLGILYAIVLYWAIRQFNKSYTHETNTSGKKVELNKYSEKRNTRLLALAGFVLLFFVGFEYFFWTGLALSLVYFISTYISANGDFEQNTITERRKNISLIFSIFFLLFILFHGATERLGIVLDLYSLDEVSQYSWPMARILFFIPIAIIVTSMAIYWMWKVLRLSASQNQWSFMTSKKGIRIIDLLTLTGFIGVLSIWPTKISIFYSLFLVLAIFAFNRIERRFNLIDFSEN